MASFPFRAQAALDLRRAQDDEAQRALAHADGEVRHALTRLERATNEVAQAIAAASAEGRLDVTTMTWHRNWIVARRQHEATRHDELEDRRRQAHLAAQAAQHARRRLRSLERLRERALRAFLAAERRVQQKELDALGTMQYVARTIREEDSP